MTGSTRDSKSPESTRVHWVLRVAENNQGTAMAVMDCRKHQGTVLHCRTKGLYFTVGKDCHGNCDGRIQRMFEEACQTRNIVMESRGIVIVIYRTGFVTSNG